MGWLRTIGSFLYSALLCAAFFLMSAWIIPRFIIHAHGFILNSVALCFTFVWFAWVSERGIELASIPYNWLWDKSHKTRVATMIPPVLFELWYIVWPFFLPMNFSIGDWIIVIVWEFCALFFNYNMFMLPFLNQNMGARE